MKVLRNPAVAAILASVFLLMVGVFAILPILPLYLRERGISYSVAGLIVGANPAAQFVFQYPAGWLSDRIGRRPVMIAGLVVAALANAALILPVPAGALVLIRFAQGAGTATFVPAAYAAVADAVPAHRRGEAFGLFGAAMIAGLTIGPGIGGLLAGFGRGLVFEATAVVVLVDALVVRALVASTAHQAESATASPPTLGRWAFAAIALALVGTWFLYGSYDLVWPLFLRSFGATDFMIGASFTLFGLPFVLVSPFAGRLADRYDKRWLAVAGLLIAGLLAPVYPLLHSFWPIVAVGIIEAAAVAVASPAAIAFLMDRTPETQRGRVQGAVGALQFGAQAIGASAAGPLFAISVGAPFFVGGAICVIAVIASIPLFRAAGSTRAGAQSAALNARAG